MFASFVYDFAIILVFAFLSAFVFNRIRQPVVFGYILTGVLIGPYMFRLVSSSETINVLAELGIILLMYSIGLKLNIEKLRRIGVHAILIGAFEILLLLAIGNALGRILGWSYTESIFLGAIIAFSSTAAILKILMDMKVLRRTYSLLILGILLVEDIGAIVMITILSSITMVGETLIRDALLVLSRVVVFFLVTLLLGLKFVPSFIDKVKETGGRELLLLTTLGLCFALASFSDILGFSVALGAFMMGVVISGSKHSNEVEIITGPVRDIFASIFFVSVGMLVDVFILKNYLPAILLISFIAVLGKIACISLGSYYVGYKGITALTAGLGMIPRGEFSLIIAKVGVDNGTLGPDFYVVTIALVLITTLAGSISLPFAPRLTDTLGRITPIRVKSFFKYSSTFAGIIGGQLKLDEDAKNEVKKHFRDIGVNLVIILIVYQAVVLLKFYALKTLDALASAMFNAIGVTPPPWFNPNFIIILTGLFLVSPSLYFIIRDIQALIDLSISIAVSKVKFLEYKAIKDTIRSAVYVALFITFTFTILPILISEAVGVGIILELSVLFFIVLSGIFFWRIMGGFHAKLHEAIRETLQVGEEASEDIDSIIENLEVERDFDFEEVEIPVGSVVAGKTIAESKLAAVTGATIVEIERGSRKIRNPKPSEILLEGDTLLIIGTEEERKSARKYLSIAKAPKDERDISLARLRVTSESPIVGKTLGESRIRTLTGVTIIAIERGEEIIKNPKPQNVIKEGDTLLIIGKKDEINEAKRYLSGK